MSAGWQGLFFGPMGRAEGGLSGAIGGAAFWGRRPGFGRRRRPVFLNL